MDKFEKGIHKLEIRLDSNSNARKMLSSRIDELGKKIIDLECKVGDLQGGCKHGE